MVENIDWPSFGVGVATGVAATVAVNRAWKYVSNLGADAEKAVVRTVAQAEADRGYLRALVEMAQAAHLMGHKLRLSDILIQPHFIRPPDLVTLPDEDADLNRSVFEVVPRVHDYPYLHAPFNLPNIEIDDLGRGDGTLALIGLPGSGRTTALLTIALWSAGFVDFTRPDDEVAQQLREQEEDLTPQQQAERVKRRIAIVERARQQFAQSRAEKGDKDAETTQAVEQGGTPLGQVDDSSSRFRQLAPIYVHLANVMPASGEYGRLIDPAEPLVRGLQATVGWLTSKRLVGKTYKLLEKGQALVLIDGYDDIPHQERPAVMAWLKHFIDVYRDNFIIVAMPPDGYGPLMEVGAMPVYLRPWDDQQQFDSTMKWVEQWENITETPIQYDHEEYREPEPFYKLVGTEARSMNALDTTLHIWTNFTGQPGNESEQMAAYLRTVLPDVDDVLEQLEQMAAMQLDNGYITHGKLVARAMERELARLDSGAAAPDTNGAGVAENAESEDGAEVAIPELEPEPEPIAEAATEPVVEEDGLAEFYGHITATSQAPKTTDADEQANVEAVTSQPDVESDATASANGASEDDGNILADIPEEEMTESEKVVAKQQRQISREQSRLLKTLVEAHLLVQYRGGRYQFRHHFMAAYLAARYMVDADEFSLLDKQTNLDWRYALRYLAQMRDVDFLVAQQLSGSSVDILHESVLELTGWLRFAGEEATWRSNLLRYLGNLMVANNQFTLVRERIAAALLGTRDEGALVIFRRAMQNRNPDIRKLGCLGVGVLRDAAAIDPLGQIIMQDPDVDVQTAASLALSAIGSDEALLTMVDVFEISTVREVRRAIAESLAANREHGYMTLFESVKAEDMMLRRAAVFGLGRVRADWSLITLNETFLEDAEFYVRLAAESVFSDIYEASLKGVNRYPDVLDAPWLNQWVAEQIELGNLPHDIDKALTFDEALKQKEDVLVYLLATQTIGQLGMIDRMGDIYMALRDRQEVIRDAAYRVLGEFQQRLGKPLPAPLG